jgi:oxygen-independent coproporphyrinogen-3 oxidase
MTDTSQERTGLGNYFVANYPPFSFWKPAYLPDAQTALNSPPKPGTPLGLYLHIPFCRKRCKFCYFRVYTDKNARDVETYIEALVKEVELYSKMPIAGGRPLQYVYFGGGTPSYLSVAQLRSLRDRLHQHISWDHAEEVTFECEPGTLQEHKLVALKEMGVTRLSLGIENFDDRILEANGRAHLSAEIFRAYGWARDLHFDQLNIDLIAGMVGETSANWRDCVRKTIDLSPDSVTVYQMELPFNTVFSKELPIAGQNAASSAVADWPTKREWVSYAFDELAKAGYEVSSAYTMVKDLRRCRFLYRDSLWHGADMFGTGVASFGHANGVHMQNVDTWEQYVGMLLEKGELPLGRALPVNRRELMIREMILQLKTGRVESAYFQKKFETDILDVFSDDFRRLENQGFVSRDNGTVKLTRTGLLQVDRLLPAFFEPQHHSERYT